MNVKCWCSPSRFDWRWHFLKEIQITRPDLFVLDFYRSMGQCLFYWIILKECAVWDVPGCQSVWINTKPLTWRWTMTKGKRPISFVDFKFQRISVLNRESASIWSGRTWFYTRKWRGKMQRICILAFPSSKVKSETVVVLFWQTRRERNDRKKRKINTMQTDSERHTVVSRWPNMDLPVI